MKLSRPTLTKRQAIQSAKSTILITVIISAVIVSFSIISIKFLWDMRGFQQRVIDKKENARDQLTVNIDNANKLKDSFAVFESSDIGSKTVLDALPSKFDFPALATTVQGLIVRSGLTLDSFSGEDIGSAAVTSSSVPEPIEMSYFVSVIGPYENVKEFLTTIDKSIRPMQVRSVELSGADNNMKAEIQIVSFYQPKIDINFVTEEIK